MAFVHFLRRCGPVPGRSAVRRIPSKRFRSRRRHVGRRQGDRRQRLLRLGRQTAQGFGCHGIVPSRAIVRPFASAASSSCLASWRFSSWRWASIGSRGVFPTSARRGRPRAGLWRRRSISTASVRRRLPQLFLLRSQCGRVSTGFDQPGNVDLARSSRRAVLALQLHLLLVKPRQLACNSASARCASANSTRRSSRATRRSRSSVANRKLNLGIFRWTAEAAFYVFSRGREPPAVLPVELEQSLPGVGQRGGLLHRLLQVTVHLVLHVDRRVDARVAAAAIRADRNQVLDGRGTRPAGRAWRRSPGDVPRRSPRASGG